MILTSVKNMTNRGIEVVATMTTTVNPTSGRGTMVGDLDGGGMKSLSLNLKELPRNHDKQKKTERGTRHGKKQSLKAMTMKNHRKKPFNFTTTK